MDVSQIEPSQAHEMNLVAQKYGLLSSDYFSFLTQDFEEAETLRQARKQEEEKAMYSVNNYINSNKYIFIIFIYNIYYNHIFLFLSKNVLCS